MATQTTQRPCRGPEGAAEPATASRRCTKCGETKALAEFYLRRTGDPSGPRRTQCIDCGKAYAKRRQAEGPSAVWQVMMHGTSRPELLTEKARAEVFPDTPLDPELVAAWRARQKAKAAKERRQERLRAAQPNDLQHYWHDLHNYRQDRYK